MRLCFALACLAGPVLADPPVIEAVTAYQSTNSWLFDVTIRHPDTGWDHYADGWRVQDMQGNELGMRVLHHPHETEKPFTRSLGGVVIGADHTQAQIQSRCNVDGWSEEIFVVQLQ
ncbi:MAG: hypothetical protein JJ897_10965 [Marinibacterium sp.]|nr:hypothetical protein [Marinibacterium sp.]